MNLDTQVIVKPQINACSMDLMLLALANVNMEPVLLRILTLLLASICLTIF